MADSSQESGGITRRQALVGGAGAVGVLALGGYGLKRALGGDAAPVAPADVVIRATPAKVEFGSRTAATWTYGGVLPGREVRIRQGDPIRIRVENGLPEPTSVHWHGIRLANSADGVPGMTQDPIAPGDSFTYSFTPPDAGTYFFHSHVGAQLDSGLYAPLIVEPRREPMSYDREAVLILDDWLDGLAGTPAARLSMLKRNGMNMGGTGGANMDGMDMGGTGTTTGSGMGGRAPLAPMGMNGRLARHTDLRGRAAAAGSLPALANLLESGRADPGDVRDYPLYVINGRAPEDPHRLAVSQGDRVRLRLVNASADTIFCFFIEGQTLTVTHADGLPVTPVATDAVLLGMGERYDVMIDARAAGVRRIFAMPLGKVGRAVGVLRTGSARGRAPAPSAPFTMPERIVSYADLENPNSAPKNRGGARETRLDLDIKPGGGYVWTLGGRTFDEAPTMDARMGELQRYVMANKTMMPHPMHLHGHSFRAVSGGPTKDTILVPPMREVAIEWLPDNPGTWAFHCHNVYHQESGMMRRIRVSQ